MDRRKIETCTETMEDESHRYLGERPRCTGQSQVNHDQGLDKSAYDDQKATPASVSDPTAAPHSNEQENVVSGQGETDHGD